MSKAVFPMTKLAWAMVFSLCLPNHAASAGMVLGSFGDTPAEQQSGTPAASAPSSESVPAPTATKPPAQEITPTVSPTTTAPAASKPAPSRPAQASSPTAPTSGDSMASKWKATPTMVAKRLESVRILLHKSSGAKQIAEKGAPDAINQLEEAKKLHQQAETAYHGGNLVQANDLLGKATNTMFQAVRQSDASGVTGGKDLVDFNNRMESVKVLRDAHTRIIREKGQETQGRETDKQLDSMMGRAKELVKQGQVKEGRVELDKGYVTLKLAIEKLRRGDTLVRSLHFASKAEEFDYEIDRNNTHEMLINVLAKEKGGDPMIQNFVAKAKALRKEADALAGKGDHGGAIGVMEKSTAEYIKAIRSAGIFIPG